MSERGFASTWAVALLAVLLLVTAALAWVGGLLVAHRHAQSAADLAALAGAANPVSGCGASAVVAERNGARLTQCREHFGHVWVTVQVAAPALAGHQPEVLGRAHAGPSP